MNEVTLFDKVKNLLDAHSMTVTEICNRLNRTHREVQDVLESNPYSFDFKMNRGTKLWTAFEA